jgi:hypothetical protein
MDERGNTDAPRNHIYPPESFEGVYIFDLPLPVVDAHCLRSLATIGFTVRRRQLTTGSVEYRLLGTRDDLRGKELIELVIEMVDHGTTIVRSVNKEGSVFGAALANVLPGHLAHFIQNRQVWTTQLRSFRELNPPRLESSYGSALQSLSQRGGTQSTVGRPPTTDNEWARQEIQRGRDRKEVFAEYLQRQLVDTNNEKALQQARDRFRKALQGRKGS